MECSEDFGRSLINEQVKLRDEHAVILRDTKIHPYPGTTAY